MIDPPKPASITLMGMKHSGKTTLGRRLAALLGCEFADLDECVEFEYDPERSVSFREIYLMRGPEAFRSLERTAAARLAAGLGEKRAVVALGGGTIENPDAVAALRSRGATVYLDESEDRLYERITDRGVPAYLRVADPRAEFGRLYARRVPLYRAEADMTVALSGNGIDTAFGALLDALIDAGYVPKRT